MLFNSLEFVLFFPSVAFLYFTMPARFRWAFLLLASYVFYMAWEPGYAVLIWISTLVDYFAALGIARAAEKRRKRAYLLLSCFTNLGLLFFFKYFNFFSDALRPIMAKAGLQIELPYSELLLPVGISFYTFQTLGYTIDVYRGKQEAERHLGRFALYVSFFPQLVAGPIERAKNLLPQFRALRDFDYARVADGLKLMLWGLFKKVVIADRLAVLVEYMYSDPARHPGPALVLATVFFTYQIYCDFSGYSDIAIGAAQVLGFKLSVNFRRPFAAVSIQDFWRRWHISLSTWFRDYVYIPLGGGRGGGAALYRNIVIVFLLSGLWHGAAWTYVIWGLLHAGYMLAGLAARPLRERAARSMGLARLPRLHRAVRVCVTFALVNFAFIFFRADSLGDAAYIATHLFSGWGVLFDPAFLGNTMSSFGLRPYELALAFALVLFLEGVQLLQSKGPVRERIARQSVWVRWAVYSAGLWLIFLFGVLRQTEFIYFTFWGANAMKQLLCKGMLLMALNAALGVAFILAHELHLDYEPWETDSALLTMPRGEAVDLVVLGSSHAYVLSRFRENHRALEAGLGMRVANLAAPAGGGLKPARFHFEYFLERGNSTKQLLFLLDPFVFYNVGANEEHKFVYTEPFRFGYLKLLIENRYPMKRIFTYVRSKFTFDWLFQGPELMIAHTFTREGDPPDAELIAKRFDSLYTEGVDPANFGRYKKEFLSILERCQDPALPAPIEVHVVAPPTLLGPEPGAAEVLAWLRELAAEGRYDLRVTDLAEAMPELKYFYDLDHLNKDGVVHFVEECLRPLLSPRARHERDP